MESVLKEALEQYEEDSEAVREMHAAMREDLEFSNPADPQQWDADAEIARKGRPTLTLDNSNQYVMQVVNDHRQNKSSIDVLPADSEADAAVATQLNGMIRQIEYASRADIAKDTSLEHAARSGLGWMRVVPMVVRPETNEQEIRIQRVHDLFSVKLDCNSTEPDGSDAMRGFVESTMSERAFRRKYPKAEISDWHSERGNPWFTKDSVRICEYFCVEEGEENYISVDDKSGTELRESEYWDNAEKIGYKPKVRATYKKKKRTVKWYVMSGVEILSETVYPSQWIGLIPVIGHELWIEGKRHLCGMVRGLKDGQRLHNMEMSALLETLGGQPKAPLMVPVRGMDGLDQHYQGLNAGNPAYLPYNDMDGEGNPIAAPTRLMPAPFPVGHAQAAALGREEMQAGVGMYRSNLGQQSNAISGRAKLADQREGDTANFHYVDNLRRSVEHMGRIIVDMIPKVYDTKRQAMILREDGQHAFISINPELKKAAKFKPDAQGNPTKRVLEINPSVGTYGVRVKTGPSYSTLRQETADNLAQITKAAPQLAPILMPALLKMQDFPDAEKISRVLLSTLPPEVQKAYQDDESGPDIPPQVAAEIDGLKGQVGQAMQALQQAHGMIQQLQGQVDEKHGAAQAALQKNQIDLMKMQSESQFKGQELEIQRRDLGIQEFNAETQRMKVTGEMQVPLQQQIDEFAALANQNALQMQDNHSQLIGAINQLNQSHQALAQHVMSPPEIIRGPDGKATGIRKGNVTLGVVRDDAGQIAAAVPTAA